MTLKEIWESLKSNDFILGESRLRKILKNKAFGKKSRGHNEALHYVEPVQNSSVSNPVLRGGHQAESLDSVRQEASFAVSQGVYGCETNKLESGENIDEFLKEEIKI